MPFFEPLPPPPEPGEEQPTGWIPPAWDRPSEATIGAPVALTAVLAKTEQVAVVLTTLHAYENGFTFELVFQRNPMAPRRADEEHLRGPMMFFGPPHLRARGPRLGIEFADGSRVTDFGLHPFSADDKDDRGYPTRPFLRPHGGGGGGNDRWGMGFWCYPLPPRGPMDVFVEFESMGIAETKTTLDASSIVDAARHVLVLWEPGGRGEVDG